MVDLAVGAEMEKAVVTKRENLDYAPEIYTPSLKNKSARSISRVSAFSQSERFSHI